MSLLLCTLIVRLSSHLLIQLFTYGERARIGKTGCVRTLSDNIILLNFLQVSTGYKYELERVFKFGLNKWKD